MKNREEQKRVFTFYEKDRTFFHKFRSNRELKMLNSILLNIDLFGLRGFRRVPNNVISRMFTVTNHIYIIDVKIIFLFSSKIHEKKRTLPCNY